MRSTVNIKIEEINWDKGSGLVPAIVQDVDTGSVLMMGYMNRKSLRQTIESGNVTFYSRSRHALWTKGETSGNLLRLKGIWVDCDQDCLLVGAQPAGPTCHHGTVSCFGRNSLRQQDAIRALESTLADRISSGAAESYTASLIRAGHKRIAQKVGEEALEVALAATGSDSQELLEETADLMYHLLVLIRSKGLSFADVEQVLVDRSK